MKYFKSASGEVYAYESDGSQDAWIKPDLVPMTPEEIESHLNPTSVVIVPQSCTRRQGRLALLEVGKLDDVEAYIEAIEDPMTKRQAQIEYEADTWERDNPLLQQLWAALGGTETELDDLFILAATK